MFIGEAHISKGPVDSPKRLLEATDGFATKVKHVGLHTGNVDPILPANTVEGSRFIQFRGEQMFPRDNMCQLGAQVSAMCQNGLSCLPG